MPGDRMLVTCWGHEGSTVGQLMLRPFGSGREGFEVSAATRVALVRSGTPARAHDPGSPSFCNAPQKLDRRCLVRETSA
jgi:hypothetical protein